MWMEMMAAMCAAAGGDATPMRPAPQIVELWPAGRLAPGEKPELAETVKSGGGRTMIRVSHVSKPTLTVTLPERPASEPAPAVIVCPGGGYNILAWDYEGTQVAAWLNSLGFVAGVLKYRVPNQRDNAFADAQRAMGILRHRAGAWGVDVRRCGILGFSAGGHLSARLAGNYGERSYERVDAADDLPCRPDFTVLIYPAYLTTDDEREFDANALPVDKRTPPAFLAVAGPDKYAPSSLVYFRALREAGVRAELHIFQGGGHGFGMDRTGSNAAQWPALCKRWLQEIKVLSPNGASK